MALEHAHAGQAIDITPFGARLREQQSTALFKSTGLEVIRLVLAAGRSLPPHRVDGEITLQCIEGRLEVGGGEATRVLEAGQMLYFGPGALHDVRASVDSSALLTIVLRHAG